MKGSPLVWIGILAAVAAATAVAVHDPLKRFIVGRLPNPNPVLRRKAPQVLVVSLPAEARGMIRA